jgi:hypothetical protein
MAFARTPDALAELNLDGMISHRYPLSGVADGIDATGRGVGAKTLVKPRMVE